MKQYYKTTKKIGDTINIAYWHGEQSKAETFLSKTNFDYIIPLGTRKPRNIPTEQFMEI